MTVYNNPSCSPRTHYSENQSEMIGQNTDNRWCHTPPPGNNHSPLVPLMNCRRQAPPLNKFHEKYQLSPKFNEYQPMETIGMGSFGKIVRVRRRGDMKNTYVWKELNVSYTNKLMINDPNLT